MENGKVVLPSNATYYGALALYACQPNFELDGVSRRLCLENGTWSSDAPRCRGRNEKFKIVYCAMSTEWYSFPMSMKVYSTRLATIVLLGNEYSGELHTIHFLQLSSRYTQNKTYHLNYSHQ